MFSYLSTCLPEWTDYNGHMNDALYGRVFSDAIDQMMAAVGLDPAYRTATQGTLYTVEDHRWYEREVKAGAALEVKTSILASDAKRIHIWQVLTAEGARCAACETMLLHVSQAGGAPKTAAMPESVQAKLREAKAQSPAQSPSPRAGVMGLRSDTI